MKKLGILTFIGLGVVLFSSVFLGYKPRGFDIVRADMDTSTSPRKDFFQYANGGWIKRNPIPASESHWGIGNLVEEDIKQKLRDINEKAASVTALPGSDSQKIGDFYRTGMDSIRLNREGLQPLARYLASLDSAKTLSQLWALSARYRTIGIGTFFGLGVSQDEKNSDKIAVSIYQGGLGLPNRDYYLKNDPRTTHIQGAYHHYLAQLLNRSTTGSLTDSLELLGRINPVYDFEKNLALHSKPLEDLRDPVANYHKMSLDGFQKLSPHVDWKAYLKICGLVGVDSVIVGQPDFIRALDHRLDSTPLACLKAYVRLQVLNDYSTVLSDDLFDDNFRFYHTILSGEKDIKPRWKRVIETEERSMGMLLGRLFIRTYFSNTAKLRYETMVSRVEQAFEHRISQLGWMSSETKAKAMLKLHTLHKKVGFPDRWKDFSALKTGRTSYFENVKAARMWRFQDRISKYGKPVDRTQWEMTPQTYNAYYNPSNNEIVLPAAQFLVPGVRDEDLDDAVAYGYSAASTIGHEITHGFDDEGRQFDEKGNLKEWWTPSDAQKFTARAQKMIQQFNSIKVLDTLHINGKACLGENIADLGGILIGLDAFKTTEQFRSGKKISGLTPTQRFFLGYALGWLGHEREQMLSMQILTDVHAPAKYRVNAPMQNVAEFYTAFGIKPGDPMFLPESERVFIW